MKTISLCLSVHLSVGLLYYHQIVYTKTAHNFLLTVVLLVNEILSVFVFIINASVAKMAMRALGTVYLLHGSVGCLIEINCTYKEDTYQP